MRPKVLLYVQDLIWVQNSSFPNGKHIFPNSWYIFKIWRNEISHYVWNEDSLIILCKLTIWFSAVKLKLGPKLFQFIHRFKYSFDYDSSTGFLSVGLMLYFQVFPNSRRDFGIFECYRARLFNFSQFKEKNAVLPNCYQFTKELGNWDIWSLLDFIFIRLWG